jgi:PIN domain nuclease of toxin-antitoxin system
LIVLDTHVLVWLDAGHRRLGGEARRVIDRALARDELAVSAITFWEVAQLQLKQRLRLRQSTASWREELLSRGLVEIAVDGQIGILAAGLTSLTADPADRLIVATALSGATLVTADTNLLEWPSDLSRIDAAE